MTDLEKTLDDVAKKLAKKLEGDDVKLPTLIDGFKALSAHFIAVSKPVRPPKPSEPPKTDGDFGSMRAKIEEADKQGKVN